MSRDTLDTGARDGPGVAPVMLVALLVIFDVIAVACLGYLLWSLLGPDPVVESLEASAAETDVTYLVDPDASRVDDELDLGGAPRELVAASRS
jgi:hypothetical protein